MNATGLGQGLHHVQTCLHQVPERDLSGLNRKVTGFDQTEVEHVVDEPEQMTRAAQNLTHMSALCGGQWLLFVGLEQLRKTQHRVEWRAQFVRHVRKELRLGQVGAFGFVACGQAGFFGTFAAGDVDAKAVVTRRIGQLVNAARQGDLHCAIAHLTVINHAVALLGLFRYHFDFQAALGPKQLKHCLAQQTLQGYLQQVSKRRVGITIGKVLVKHRNVSRKHLEHLTYLAFSAHGALQGARFGGDVAKAPHPQCDVVGIGVAGRHTAAQQRAAIAKLQHVVSADLAVDNLLNTGQVGLRVVKAGSAVFGELTRRE